MQQPVPSANPDLAPDAPQALFGGTSHAKGHFVTEGEKRFDFRAYTLLNYIVNAAISVVAVWFIDRTKPGQAGLSWFSQRLGKATGANPENIKFFTTKTFFLAGGFVVLAPVKWMEDRKVEWVKKWNREIYGERAEHDPQIRQSEKEIEQAPKQNWSSIFASRALALVPFYLGYWLIWERKSPLSKLTNPELRAMSKDGIAAMEKSDPEKFSSIAKKGVYIDRPIAGLSRWIGKGAAKLTGDTQAAAQLAQSQKTYPGMVKAGVKGDLRDPVHSALPYYTISEAITSGMVAAGVYALTRVLGPILGTKQKQDPVQQQDIPAAAAQQSASAEEPAKTGAQPATQVSRVHVSERPPAEVMAAAR